MSSRRWALKRESYENRSAVSVHDVHVGQSDHRGQLNVIVNAQQPSGPEHSYVTEVCRTSATSAVEDRQRNFERYALHGVQATSGVCPGVLA